MQRSRCLAALILGLVLLPQEAPAGKSGASPVRISAVLFDGVLKGDPEPDSCVRLVNTDPKKKVSLGGYLLTDEYTPRRRAQVGGDGLAVERGADEATGGGFMGGSAARRVELPAGATLGPGQQIWIAHEGRSFRQVFGFLPDYEAVDTLPSVPEVDAPAGWIKMPAKQGTVTLKDAFGEVADFVAYDRNKVPRLVEADFPVGHWKGPPVLLHDATMLGWTGQILTRDRDEAGRVLPDTDTAADWDSGFAKKKLGEEPTHRLWMPGQSEFVAEPLRGVSARVWATSAPDNNHKALVEAFDGAEKEILVSVYQFTNAKVGEALLRAKQRGVDVKLWLEGSPVGGIPDQERFIVDQLARAGIPVHFLASLPKQKVKPRYKFDHSKYVLIDGKRVIIGTENYGRTGVPVDPSYGNRGWMIHIEQPGLYRQLRAVWDHDYKPGHRDVVSIHDSPSDAYGLPYKEPGFTPDDTIPRGLYDEPAKPVYVADRMDLELVLAPDTALNENTGLIGLMNRAKKTLYLQQNSIRRRWGKKTDDPDSVPDLPLEAVVAAARRGVKVRVLLDGTWYNVQGDEDRDNDNTVEMLNQLARDEGLDVAAKIINLETTHLEKIHAKGILVDGQEVFVGSINWTENSFKGNREVGVIVKHPEVAGYYEKLFLRDWSDSRMYEVEAARAGAIQSAPDRKSEALGKTKPGQKLAVVGEHGGQGNGPGWLEVRLGRARTGFVRSTAVGPPTASAREAVHLVGRNAVIEGRVTATRVSSKVIQLKFEDEVRPPFMAVVFRSSEAAFAEQGLNPAQAFQGRLVRVKGRVGTYKAPEIVLRSPDQIEIVR